MILIHLDARPGEILVRLPDGSTQWVSLADMKALAESDRAPEATTEAAPKHPAKKKATK